MLVRFKEYLQEKIQLNDDEFAKIVAGVREVTVKKGTVLLKQEEQHSKTFFVAKGLLRAYTIDCNGKEHVLHFAPEDYWIGDRSSFYFNQPSLFFIDAIEDSDIISIGLDFYERAETISQAFSSLLIRMLHTNGILLQKRIITLLAATAEERYLDFVERYPDLLLRVPQWMIATYLGITPESLSRVRKELAKRNFKP